MRTRPVTTLAESKLILLYLASRLPSGVEHDEFVRFNAAGGWMLYFEMEQYLKELADDALLQESDGGGGRRLFSVTADGLNVLGLLKSDIPLPVRSAIDAEFAERRSGMEMEQEVTADYAQDSATEYPVTLRILENRIPIFEMNLTAPSAEEAARVCARFREQAADIYASVIGRLTRDEPDDGKDMP